MDTDQLNSFLGRGWAWPVTFNKESRSAEMSEDEQDIRESLEILLTTIRGERVMRPDYGANLQDRIFEPLRVNSASRLTEDIKRAILFHEPRVTVNDVNYQQDPEEGYILIQLDYTIIATNTRTNMVYPFYFSEGTDL
ncbi:MAG: GPW/gp25 family protein [Flavobacteriales bacterium]|nr:GPW/gp25 family protein [Flavobacteriales bacterium]